MRHKIKLYGVIGSYWDDAHPKYVGDEIDALKADDEIVVHINSPGGSATAGVAIYNALKNHPGQVTVIVDGIAASSASIVAMAGDKIVMRKGALMMIHNPWSITMGDANDHRKSADVLDKHRDSLAEIYVAASGKSVDDVNDIMAEETWYTAQEAVDAGFATETDGDAGDEKVAAMVVGFADELQKFNRVPDRLRAEIAAAMREHPQSIPKRAEAQGEAPMTKEEKERIEAEAKAAADAQALRDKEIRAKAIDDEIFRQTEIRRVCAVAKVADLADKLISEKVSVDAAREQVINALAERPDPIGMNATASITGGKSEQEKFVEGAEQAILARMGKVDRDPRNEFNGMSLKEIARISAKKNGIDVRGLGSLDMVGAVLAAHGGHSTSDFPLILDNITRKMVREGFEAAPETFRQWTNKGSAPDFRPFNSVSLGSFSELDIVIEGAEFTHGTIGESGETGKIATYGKLFTITRQAIIDDTLDLFSRIPRKMGESWLRTIAATVAAVLSENNAMGDGELLFSAAHGNDLDGALTADNIKLAMIAMSDQVDEDGAPLDIEPKFLLVGTRALEFVANDIVGNQFVSGDAGLQTNQLYRALEVVYDSRLGGDYWYLAGDASDTVQVSYLDGVEAPYLEQKQGWTIDGTTYKVRGDVGAHAVDYRALVRVELP